MRIPEGREYNPNNMDVIPSAAVNICPANADQGTSTKVNFCYYLEINTILLKNSVYLKNYNFDQKN